MQRYNIVRPKKYEKNGEEKTAWLQVGTIVQFDDGGIALELNHTSEKLMVFKQELKEQSYGGTTHQRKNTTPPPQNNQTEEIKVEDIPF